LDVVETMPKREDYDVIYETDDGAISYRHKISGQIVKTLPSWIDADADTEATMRQRAKALAKITMTPRKQEVKRLSRTHHPDKGGDPVVFKILREVLNAPVPWHCGDTDDNMSGSNTSSVVSSRGVKRRTPTPSPERVPRSKSSAPKVERETTAIQEQRREKKRRKVRMVLQTKTVRNITKELRAKHENLGKVRKNEEDAVESHQKNQADVEKSKKQLDTLQKESDSAFAKFKKQKAKVEDKKAKEEEIAARNRGVVGSFFHALIPEREDATVKKLRHQAEDKREAAQQAIDDLSFSQKVNEDMTTKVEVLANDREAAQEAAVKIETEIQKAKVYKAQVVRVAEVDLSKSLTNGPLALTDAGTKSVVSVTRKVEVGPDVNVEISDFLNSDLVACLDPDLDTQVVALGDGQYLEVDQKFLKSCGIAEVRKSGSSSSSSNNVQPHEMLRVSLGDKDVGKVPLRLELADTPQPLPKKIREIDNSKYQTKVNANILAITDNASEALCQQFGLVPVDGKINADAVASYALAVQNEDWSENTKSFEEGTKVPDGFFDGLRPYQIKGLQWMASLASDGFGALLADDMGLGKTVQAIKLLQYAKTKGWLKTKNGREPAPALVIVPPALMDNWLKEFEKWQNKDPNARLQVRTFHGPGRGPPSVARAVGADVVLTTYGVARQDQAAISKEPWGGIIIDEAQRIKNPSAKTSRAVKAISAACSPGAGGKIRVALSGTPIETRLEELHSIMDFVMPGYLGTVDDFRRKFVIPITQETQASNNSPKTSPKSESDSDGKSFESAPKPGKGLLRTWMKNITGKVAEQEENPEEEEECTKTALLKRLMEPFMLRRLKNDKTLLPDLPDIVHYDETVDLTPAQRTLYEDSVLHFKKELVTLRAEGENMEQRKKLNTKRAGLIFKHMNHLRYVCGHPATLEKANVGLRHRGLIDTADSGKASWVMDFLVNSIDAQEKVLIFCTRKKIIYQLQKMIEHFMPNHGTAVISGDQKMDDRLRTMEKFNNSQQIRVLLLTLEAGGVGLNLTGASHVIHFDRCYNPAREQQATDRAHRMGQKNLVCVHRLSTRGTYEEKIDRILKDRVVLGETLSGMSEPSWVSDFSDGDLVDLFAL